MEVLKDSAASSLYGSRAANGVIQIFTKRGNTSFGTNVKIRSEYGISYIPENRLPQIAQHHNYLLDSSGGFLLDNSGGFQLEDDKIIDNDFPDYLIRLINSTKQMIFIVNIFRLQTGLKIQVMCYHFKI